MPQGEVAAALAEATRLETPCGDGVLAWHSWGGPSKDLPPLVLLHGGSGSWTHWVRNVRALAATGRYVLVPDLPGFGESALPRAGRDADALPQPLDAGLESIIGSAAVDLVGFSFGGLTAGLMAAALPQRVKRLVFVGAPGLGLASRRAVALKPWKHLPDRQARRDIHRHNLQMLMLHDPAAIDSLAVDIQEANLPRDRMLGRRLAFTDALAQALRAVGCPVHAIYGAEDVLYQGKRDALDALIRASSPTLQGIEYIQGAGHWVQYEAPDAFHAALLGALMGV